MQLRDTVIQLLLTDKSHLFTMCVQYSLQSEELGSRSF